MKESSLKRSCLKAIKKEQFKNFCFYCPMDSCHGGVPDFLFIADGFAGAIELKTGKGRVSKIQQYTHEKIRQAKGRVVVCRNVKEFIDFIRSFYRKGGDHGTSGN